MGSGSCHGDVICDVRATQQPSRLKIWLTKSFPFVDSLIAETRLAVYTRSSLILNSVVWDGNFFEKINVFDEYQNLKNFLFFIFLEKAIEILSIFSYIILLNNLQSLSHSSHAWCMLRCNLQNCTWINPAKIC